MPTFTYSARVMSLPHFQEHYQLFTSPICLAIAYYFAEKKCGSKRASEKMQILSSQIKVTSVGQKEVFLVYNNKKITDYEEGWSSILFRQASRLRTNYNRKYRGFLLFRNTSTYI